MWIAQHHRRTNYQTKIGSASAMNVVFEEAMDTLLMELESINHELRKIGVKDVDKLDSYNAKLSKKLYGPCGV